MTETTPPSAPNKFLLITPSLNDSWIEVLRTALRPLGSLDSILVEDMIAKNISGLDRSDDNRQSFYSMVVIDAVVLDEIEKIMTAIRSLQPKAPIVVATTSPTWQRARRVFRAGASDYIRKSLDPEVIRTTFLDVLEKSSYPGFNLSKDDSC